MCTPPENPTQPKHSTDRQLFFIFCGFKSESMDLNIISVHGMVCWQCIMPCSIPHPLPKSSSLSFWTRVITTRHAVPWDALRLKCLQSSSQLRSIVHQDINCTTGNIALVQRLPPGTHKTDGFISTQPFTSALQLGRSTSKFPTIFA